MATFKEISEGLRKLADYLDGAEEENSSISHADKTILYERIIEVYMTAAHIVSKQPMKQIGIDLMGALQLLVIDLNKKIKKVKKENKKSKK